MAAEFRKQHPEMRLQLTALGSLDAADRILDGRETPDGVGARPTRWC